MSTKRNINHKVTVSVSVNGNIAKTAKHIAQKVGLKRTQILSMATEAGWAIVLKRWQNAMEGID